MLNCQHAIMEDLINSRKVTVQGLLNYSWDGDMQLVCSYSNCIYCLETNSFIDWSPLSHVSLHVVVATNPHNSEYSFCFSLTHWLTVSQSLSQVNMRPCKHQKLVLCLRIHFCVDSLLREHFNISLHLQSGQSHPLGLNDSEESLRYWTGYWKKHILE